MVVIRTEYRGKRLENYIIAKIIEDVYCGENLSRVAHRYGVTKRCVGLLFDKVFPNIGKV